MNFLNWRKFAAAFMLALAIGLLVGGLILVELRLLVSGIALILCLSIWLATTMLARVNAALIQQTELRAEVHKISRISYDLAGKLGDERLLSLMEKEFGPVRSILERCAARQEIDGKVLASIESHVDGIFRSGRSDRATVQAAFGSLDATLASLVDNASELMAVVSDGANRVSLELFKSIEEGFSQISTSQSWLGGTLLEQFAAVNDRVEAVGNTRTDEVLTGLEQLSASRSRQDEVLHGQIQTVAERVEAAQEAVATGNTRTDEVLTGLEQLSASRSRQDEVLHGQIQTVGERVEAAQEAVATGNTRTDEVLTGLEQLSASRSRQDEVLHGQIAALTAFLAEAQDAVVRVGSVLSNLTSEIQVLENAQKGGLATAVSTLQQGFTVVEDHSRTELNRVFNGLLQELDALLQMHLTLAPKAMSPLLGDWAMAPAGMHGVLALLIRLKPKLIVECGSGASTVWIARVLKLLGKGIIISLEHLEEYWTATQEGLFNDGMDGFADVRLAPLTEVEGNGSTWNWYGVGQKDFKPGSIDVLIVDGPPGSLGPQARYPAMFRMKKFLSNTAVVIVDDCDRPGELEVIARWMDENPELQVIGKIGPRTQALRFVRS